MKAGQLFLGLGALALIFALVIIGPYPNPSWQYQSTWITTGLMSLVGLFSIGIGTFVMIGEPIGYELPTNKVEEELVTIIFSDTSPIGFLEPTRRINLTGSVQYQSSTGEMRTFYGQFSLWMNGGVVLHHGNRVEDILTSQVKSVEGSGSHNYHPVKVSWGAKEQAFTVEDT